MKNIKFVNFLCSKMLMFIFFSLMLLSNCYLWKFNYLLTLSYFIEIILIFLCFFYRKFNSFIYLMLIYISFCLFSSYVNAYSSFFIAFFNYLPIFSLTLYFNLCLNISKEKTIFCLENVFLLLILINFLTIILYPNGMYGDELYNNNWFFKYDNLHIFMFLPGLLISFISSRLKNKRITLKNIFMLIMVLYSVFFCFSANSIVAISFLLLYLFFPILFKNKNLFNISTYIIIFIAFFLLFIVFRFQNYFSWFIVDILGKDITFTNRTFIWDIANYYILKKPFLGYGYENYLIIAYKFGNLHFTHAHNTILDVLYKSGFCGLLSFFSIFFVACKNLYINRDKWISKFISFGLFCALIMMLFEARESNIGLYFILLLAFYNERIEEYMEVFYEKN